MKSFCTLLVLGTILLQPTNSLIQEKLGEFLGGCLLTAVVILPSNPYPDNVSYSRYALGTVGGIIGVSFTGRYLFHHRENSSNNTIVGGIIGGVAGTYILYLAKKGKLKAYRESEGENYNDRAYSMDIAFPSLANMLLYIAVLAPPAWGASIGFNHDLPKQSALIRSNCSQFILNFPKIIFSTRRDYFKNPYGIYQCRIFEFDFD